MIDCSNQQYNTTDSTVLSNLPFSNLFCKEDIITKTSYINEEIEMLYNDGEGMNMIVIYNVTQNYDTKIKKYTPIKNDYRYNTLSTDILNDNTLLNLRDI